MIDRALSFSGNEITSLLISNQLTEENYIDKLGFNGHSYLAQASWYRVLALIYGITSLNPTQADAETLLKFVQQHWTIENRLHWVQDVTMGEDHCQLHAKQTHHLLTLFRNVALSLLRLNRLHNIASALCTFAAQLERAIDLVAWPVGE